MFDLNGCVVFSVERPGEQTREDLHALQAAALRLLAWLYDRGSISDYATGEGSYEGTREWCAAAKIRPGLDQELRRWTLYTFVAFAASCGQESVLVTEPNGDGFFVDIEAFGNNAVDREIFEPGGHITRISEDESRLYDGWTQIANRYYTLI